MRPGSSSSSSSSSIRRPPLQVGAQLLTAEGTPAGPADVTGGVEYEVLGLLVITSASNTLQF
jgi:hypothetical protein